MALWRTPGRGRDRNEDDEIQSIVDNLNNVLNSKRGYSYFLSDFGISDLNHYHSRDDIARAVIREVADNVERFEPRVQLVDIVEIKDDALFRLSFRIDCIVRNNSRSLSMVLDPILERYLVSPP